MRKQERGKCKALADLIQVKRMGKGYSLRKAAEFAGIATSSYCRYEKATAFPTYRALKGIARALEITQDELKAVYEADGNPEAFENFLKAHEDIKNVLIPSSSPTKVVDFTTKEEAPVNNLSSLKIMKRVEILDLEGECCCYHVNTETGEISMNHSDKRLSLVCGQLDRETIDVMIRELQEIKKLLA